MNNKVYESSIAVNATLAVTSTAINGLLKVPGNLTDVRDNYHIDVKKDIAKRTEAEIQLLYTNIFSKAKTIDLKLVELADSTTRINYHFEKRNHRSAVIALFIFQFILAAFMGAAFSTIGEQMGSTRLIVGLIAFAIAWLIFSFLPMMGFKLSNDKVIEKGMNKFFAERINSYVAIVKRNQK